LSAQHRSQPLPGGHRQARPAQVRPGGAIQSCGPPAPGDRSRADATPTRPASVVPSLPDISRGTTSVQPHRVECALGSNKLTLETGWLAKQAHGAVVVRYGDTMTLTAATEGKADPAKGFFPLVVDYREKMSAGGKFPGGFIKREGRPTMKETLTSRLIDRPIRPLFPAGYINEVQILCSC